jgi:hypothetical protein
MAPVISTVIYPVKDLAKARTLYGALLGVAPAQDESYYVGFRRRRRQADRLGQGRRRQRHRPRPDPLITGRHRDDDDAL